MACRKTLVIFTVFLCILLPAIIYIFHGLTPKLLVVSYSGGQLYKIPVSNQLEFSIEYVHSVQKVYTVEKYLATKEGIFMTGTVIKDFGAGLPYEKSDNYKKHGYSYIISGLKVPTKELVWRISNIAKQQLRIDNKELIPLYALVEDGERIVFRLQ